MRRIMRGYRILKNSKKLDAIASVKKCLTVEINSINEGCFSRRIYGAGLKYAEKITTQYLLVKIGGLGLNKALLYSVGEEGGRVIYPLPKFWRRVIESHNFKVSNFWCSLLWQLYIILYLGFGLLKVLKIFLSGAGDFKSKNSSNKCSSYVYFDGLVEGNLQNEIEGRRNIFSWYLQWHGRKKNIQSLKHNVGACSAQINLAKHRIEFQRSPVPSLVGLISRLQYLSWGLTASLIAFVDALRGHWWHAFLLNQAADLGKVIHTKPHMMAREYLFHNSGWIYRPLWTYEAEARGSEISFYFYSTNCENFMKKDGSTSISYGWKAMTWSRYLVWDDRQAEYIKEAVGIQNISVVGEIWFLNGMQFDAPIAFDVAVFDVQPVRNSFYCTLGLEIEYYRPNTSILFLSDIYNLLSDRMVVALKIKREINKLAHPQYVEYLKGLALSPNFLNIDSKVYSVDIIEKCIAVISMPFTSTAIQGRAAGKPSVYYDPEGLIEKNDPAAHGIPIISGKLELEHWISRLAKSNTN